jgi:hypothetical protein
MKLQEHGKGDTDNEIGGEVVYAGSSVKGRKIRSLRKKVVKMRTALSAFFSHFQHKSSAHTSGYVTDKFSTKETMNTKCEDRGEQEEAITEVERDNKETTVIKDNETEKLQVHTELSVHAGNNGGTNKCSTAGQIE